MNPSLPKYISPRLFVDKGVFVTEAFDMGIVLQLAGFDTECLEDAETEYRVERYLAALKNVLGPDFVLYQYVRRRYGAEVETRGHYGVHPLVDELMEERVRHASGLDTIEAFLVVLYTEFRHPITFLEKAKRFFVDRMSEKLLGDDINSMMFRVQETLINATQQFVENSGGQLRWLDKHQAFSVFREIANPDLPTARMMRLMRDGYLHRQIPQQGMEVDRNHLRIGDHYVKILSLNLLPAATHANLLKDIIAARGQYLIVSCYREMSKEQARKMITWKKRLLRTSKFDLVGAFIKAVASALGQIKKEEKGEDEKPTQSVNDSVAKLEETESLMDNEDLRLGRYSMMLCAYDLDPGRLDLTFQKLHRAMTENDMIAQKETFGLRRRFFSIWPGNERFDSRGRLISNLNNADMLAFYPEKGSPHNTLTDGEYSLLLETTSGTPAYVNLNFGDSPHVCILGMNGSGKSMLMNMIVAHLQKAAQRVITLIFDVGGSYRGIVEAFGGVHIDVDMEGMPFKLNPFALPQTNRNEHFVYSFVRMLMESDGERKLDDNERLDLFQRVRGVYRQPPESRQLRSLYILLQPAMRSRLARWVRKDHAGRHGQFGTIFDNAEDTLTLHDMQCFNFWSMQDYPEIVEPLMAYVLQRHRARVYDPDLADIFKYFAIDELSEFVKHELSKEAMRSLAKRGRKHRAPLYLCTQDPQDLQDLLRILSEFGTSILFGNPNAKEAVYRECFNLSHKNFELVRTMVHKRQLMVKHAGAAPKIFEFHPTPRELALFSSSPQTEKKRRDRAKAFDRAHVPESGDSRPAVSETVGEPLVY